jgi:chromate transporter
LSSSAETLAAPQRASLVQIALVIGSIALTSFGGGQKASIRQSVVRQRKWISDDDFLEGLELAQIMPGPNLTNLVVYVGHRVRGWAGALTAFAAVSLPPFAIILIVGAIYFRIKDIPQVHSALVGCAAGAIGLTLANALDMTHDQFVWPLSLLFVAITAVAVSWFKVPLFVVLVVLGPVCIALHRRRASARAAERAT